MQSLPDSTALVDRHLHRVSEDLRGTERRGGPTGAILGLVLDAFSKDRFAPVVSGIGAAAYPLALIVYTLQSGNIAKPEEYVLAVVMAICFAVIGVVTGRRFAKPYHYRHAYGSVQ